MDVLKTIQENFATAEFQNRDLSPFIKDLTARQLPHRLKSLVADGKLEDMGGSPKKYRLI